ncbi:hypothetical protein Emed_006616 [Eimeria media]
MEEAIVDLRASAEAEAEEEEEALCTGRCTTTSLFFLFAYAATVFLYSVVAVKAPLALLPLVSTLPHLTAFAIFTNVFGKRASLKQTFFVFTSSLCLALPLLLCLPVLRHGWVMVVGLLDLAATAADMFSLVKPGFLLWALLDAFVLRACMQEALKFAVCFQLREKVQIRNLCNLTFYAAVAAITFSLVMTTNDAIRLSLHPGLVAGGPQEMQRRGALWGFAVYHGCYELPIQIVTAFLIACSLASKRKDQSSSFLQVLTGPILLYGIPAFCTQLTRHLSQNVAAKLLWGRQVEAIPQEALRAVTATTALCHFVSTAVMMGSLMIGLGLGFRKITKNYLFVSWRAYLRAKAAQDLTFSVSEKSPRFLFSVEDIMQKDYDS